MISYGIVWYDIMWNSVIWYYVVSEGIIWYQVGITTVSRRYVITESRKSLKTLKSTCLADLINLRSNKSLGDNHDLEYLMLGISNRSILIGVDSEHGSHSVIELELSFRVVVHGSQGDRAVYLDCGRIK